MVLQQKVCSSGRTLKKSSRTKSVLSGLKSNTITCNTSKDGRNVSVAQENRNDSKLLQGHQMKEVLQDCWEYGKCQRQHLAKKKAEFVSRSCNSGIETPNSVSPISGKESYVQIQYYFWRHTILSLISRGVR